MQQVHALPTIRLRFFRSLIITSLLVTTVAVLGIAIADAFFLRQLTIHNLKHYAKALSSVAQTNIEDPAELERHLNDFSHQPGLAMTCIYNASNQLTASWRSPRTTRNCPNLASAEGVEATAFDVKIIKQIGSESQFRGMVYLEGHLSEFRHLLSRMLGTLVVLMLVAGLICLAISHRAAKHISEPLQDLYTQVECLLRHERTECKLPTATQTMETAMLFGAITELRASLQSSMVPSSDMENLHQWYRGVIFGLIAMLRRRLPENSPILPAVADYALLLRLESGATMPKPAIFSLSQVCDRAFASAKRIQTPAPEVYPALSIKAGTPDFWMGHEELVESLLRNLLIISFAQSQRGSVRLRLEDSNDPVTQQKIISFSLSDTSAAGSAGVFQATLNRYADTLNATSKPLDISWALAARLPTVLGGSLTSQARQEGHLLLGHIRINHVLRKEEISQASNEPVSSSMPLVMLVEDDRMNLVMQRKLFEQANCCVFAVRSATEALEWIKLLPFSGVILDTILPDMNGPQLAERIQTLIHGNEIPAMPIWSLSASDSSEDREEWQRTGVAILLLKPLTLEVLMPLVKSLKASDNTFFLKYDIAPQEFSLRIMEQLPQLISEVGRQIQTLCAHLARHAPTHDSAEAAHALKSAALTLGYGRLAACMDALEHGLRNNNHLLDAENVAVIQRALSQNMFTPGTSL